MLCSHYLYNPIVKKEKSSKSPTMLISIGSFANTLINKGLMAAFSREVSLAEALESAKALLGHKENLHIAEQDDEKHEGEKVTGQELHQKLVACMPKGYTLGMLFMDMALSLDS